MKNIVLRRVCYAAVIAALYVVLTAAMGPMAYEGFVNLRPSEALTVLPALLPEAVWGLYFGCMIANVASSFGIFDVFLGSLVTLVAAILTRLVKNVYVGGIFPVLLNALCLPLIWLLAGGEAAYWYSVLSILVTQSVWYYALGIPLYFGMKRVLKDRLY